ncbi:energy transducer TonB [Telmatobacter sp. DSM 110680]|uniref:Energy transducer TonB n=1 Tax=Telmatobacter sp. DSM 110680 TaxID=3036704 RepID=A0AAU7DKD1_9BACT
MFEDSTFESTGRIKTRSRRWMLAALLLNGSILIALVLVPLIYPDALPSHFIPTLLVAPTPPPPETPTQPVRVRAAAPHDFSELDNGRITAPPRIPPSIKYSDGPEPPFASNIGAEISSGTPGGDGINPFGARPPVTVVHAPSPSSIRLPSKLVEGNLIFKTIPQYPVIAKATGQQGTVVLQAMISKFGTIENLQVVSGPPMLRQAAMDAVKIWRYKPYLLNQQPVEVETTVSVIFKLER